jgi:hypothetical protein
MHPEHIVTFTLEQWLRERATIMVLRTLPILFIIGVRKIAINGFKLPRVCPSVLLSTWNNSAPIGGFSWNILVFFEKLTGNFKFFLKKRRRITGSLHEDQYTFF